MSRKRCGAATCDMRKPQETMLFCVFPNGHDGDHKDVNGYIWRMWSSPVDRVRKAVAALHADAASARLMGHETSALAIEGSARRISLALDQTDTPGRIAP